MAYQHRENRGSLFKNDRKTKETQPDYTGSGLINGNEMRIAAWIKDGGKGKFMSLKFQDNVSQEQSDEQQDLPF